MDEYGLKTRALPPSPEVLVACEETAGRRGLVETVEEPGAKPPCHLRHREDETLYVIEGSLSV